MIHSRYGGSTISYVLKCPGFINATSHLAVENLVNFDGSDDSDLGSAAHEASEHCLKLGISTNDIVGQTFNGYVFDHQMRDFVNLYVNHVNVLKFKHPGKSFVEPKLTLSSIGDYVYGYTDHMHISGDTLFIDDLKYGFVMVDETTPQTAFYGVGALDQFKLWFKINKVVCTIIQPRARHVQGEIRSHEYDISDMRHWRDRISNGIDESKKPNAKRIAGSHCKYCPVRGDCRKRMEYTLFHATKNKQLDRLTDDEISAALIEFPAIRKHMEEVEALALNLARGGRQFNDFKLVKGLVRATCTDEESLVSEAAKNGFSKEKLYNPGKIKGKTVLKSLLSDTKIDLNKYFETPPAESKLVPLSDKGVAISRSARGVFKPIK